MIIFSFRENMFFFVFFFSFIFIFTFFDLIFYFYSKKHLFFEDIKNKLIYDDDFFFSFFTSKFLYKKFSHFLCVCVGWGGLGQGSLGETKEIKKMLLFKETTNEFFFFNFFISKIFYHIFFIQKKHLTIMTAILFNSCFVFFWGELRVLRVRIVVGSISYDKDL